MWTEETVALLRSMKDSGRTASEMALRLGATRNAVLGKIHRLGLAGNRVTASLASTAGRPVASDWSEGRLMRLRTLEERGWSVHEIAADLGCAKTAVEGQLRRLRKHEREDGERSEPKPPKPTLGANMKPVTLKKLERSIIKPGFEKHLEPLLYYKGGQSLGRIHRLWNFTQSLKIQGGESIADATQRLTLNPNFSHLCGPDKRVASLSLTSFWSRVLQTPAVWSEDPELVEFIKEMRFHRFRYEPLSEVTHNPNARWLGEWRTYVPRPGGGSGARQNVRDVAPKFIDYPFLIHDGGREEHRLLKLVNNAVPKYLPPDMRADVCQDLIVGILCGDFTEDDLVKPLKETLTKVRKLYPGKWGNISLDAVVPGTDSLRLIDTISEDQGLWEHA